MQRRAEEALSEPSWTGEEEEVPLWMTHKVMDIHCLIHIQQIIPYEVLEAESVRRYPFHLVISIASMRILICIHMNTS